MRCRPSSRSNERRRRRQSAHVVGPVHAFRIQNKVAIAAGTHDPQNDRQRHSRAHAFD